MINEFMAVGSWQFGSELNLKISADPSQKLWLGSLFGVTSSVGHCTEQVS